MNHTFPKGIYIYIHTMHTVEFVKMDSSHSSLLIPGGQVSAQRGRSDAGQGEADGGSEHCVTSHCLVYLLEPMT